MTAIAIPARQRHVLAFGKPLGLTDEQIDATVVGDSGDPAWSDRDARPGAHETNEHAAMHEHATRTNPALVSGVRGEGAPPLLIQLCDELCETDSVSDKLWARLAGKWPPDQLLELIVTAGWYRLISYVINTCGVQRESWAARFPASACLQTSGNPELARPSDGFPTRDVSGPRERHFSRRTRRR
jgi:4-carboxymuconolactone decarboxylase